MVSSVGKGGTLYTEDHGFNATDSNDSIDELEFKEDRSSASCDLDEIDGIIFGGTNSRFWMLRKHINSIPIEQLKKIPFYCWNCITLLTPQRCRDIDLVIKSETHMRIFIKLLVYSLRTVEGHKGTANKVLDTLLQQDIKDY
jgi:hypothetical protein